MCRGVNHGLGSHTHPDDPVFNDLMTDPDYAKYGFNEHQYQLRKEHMIMEGRLTLEGEPINAEPKSA